MIKSGDFLLTLNVNIFDKMPRNPEINLKMIIIDK